jgi:hypothetical protein
MFNNKKDLYFKFQNINSIHNKITFLNNNFNTIISQFNISSFHLNNIIKNWKNKI